MGKHKVKVFKAVLGFEQKDYKGTNGRTATV
jgi:hypothetical protein